MKIRSVEPRSLQEEIEWLTDYQKVVDNERFLEFNAARTLFLSSRCKEYRKLLAANGIAIESTEPSQG
jgi:hypothetical protein